jgi:hypothetical protein
MPWRATKCLVQGGLVHPFLPRHGQRALSRPLLRSANHMSERGKCNLRPREADNRDCRLSCSLLPLSQGSAFRVALRTRFQARQESEGIPRRRTRGDCRASGMMECSEKQRQELRGRRPEPARGGSEPQRSEITRNRRPRH